MPSIFPIPLLFVLLWSSAFIAIDMVSGHAEPLTFVVVRNELTAAVIFLIVIVRKIEWPKQWVDIIQLCAVGILINGVYAGGVFAAINRGIDLRLCAVILSLQPIVTVLLSKMFLAETISKRKVFGIAAGFTGVAMLITETNHGSVRSTILNDGLINTGNDYISISLCVLALLGISSATIMQKRYCSNVNILPSVCIQYAAAAMFLIPVAIAFESMEIDWNLNFLAGLGWLVLFVSIGAMSLLMTLIKNGEAGAVANLFYLVTPLVAIQAWIFFGEKITLHSLVGILLCTLGVVVVNYVASAKRHLINKYVSQKLIFGFIFRRIRVRVDYIKK